MTVDDIIATFNSFENADDAKLWFNQNKDNIVYTIVELDFRQIKVAIENIATAFKGRGLKTSIKEILRLNVEFEREKRLRERTKDHFQEDIELHRNDSGKITPTIDNIAKILLANKHLYIRYDEYTGQVYYEEYNERHLPWNSQPQGEWFDLNYLHEHDEKQVSVVRYHVATSRYQLAALRRYLLNFFPDEIHFKALEDAVLYAGMQNKTNIYQEYFTNGLPEWDGIDRMDFLYRHAGVKDKQWANIVGHSIFLGMMARCYNPGFDYRGVVVLEGPQNSGKSRLCRLLAFHPNFFHAFFFTQRPSEGYEPARQMIGKAVIEFPEMGNIRGRDQNYIKQFLSNTHDTNRPMHSNLMMNVARGYIFMITTNELGRYLIDPTGNTRYLPAHCTADKIDIDSIELELPQLFAQAKYLWDMGVTPHLTDTELCMQSNIVSTREMHSDYYDRVLEKLRFHRNQIVYDENENWDDGFTMDEMMQWMETEPWFAGASKSRHKDGVRKVLIKHFHFDSIVKRIPVIRRIDKDTSRKWRYIGNVPFGDFIDSIEEE